MYFLHDAAMIAPLGAIIAPARTRVAGLVAGLAPLFGCRRKPTGSTIVKRSLKDWLTNSTGNAGKKTRLRRKMSRFQALT
jgi:hypothetical protein